MVYVLCVGIMCASALIGKKIAKIVVFRDEFYKIIVVFCDYLKTNISMYQMKTNELIDGFVKNYGVSIVLDTSISCINELCILHTIQTLRILYKS